MEYMNCGCPECGNYIKADLIMGDKSFLDGFHGECQQPFCGGHIFKPMCKMCKGTGKGQEWSKKNN